MTLDLMLVLRQEITLNGDSNWLCPKAWSCSLSRTSGFALLRQADAIEAD
jgi:hypothetical protein